MFADGSNGSVEFDGDSIIIRRKGFANKLTQGFQGDKQVPVRSITAVQFRAAGSMMAGVIQFTILGGREFAGGMLEATKDENAVMFSRDQEPAFVAIRQAIQRRISEGDRPTISAVSSADELERLAALLEKGHLTADEFAEAKRRILSGHAAPRPAPMPEPLPAPTGHASRPRPSAHVDRAVSPANRPEKSWSSDLKAVGWIVAILLTIMIFGWIGNEVGGMAAP